MSLSVDELVEDTFWFLHETKGTIMKFAASKCALKNDFIQAFTKI